MSIAGLVGLTGKPETTPPLPGFQGADATGALQVDPSHPFVPIVLGGNWNPICSHRTISFQRRPIR
jgi:hypothetical protein